MPSLASVVIREIGLEIFAILQFLGEAMQAKGHIDWIDTLWRVVFCSQNEVKTERVEVREIIDQPV
jgi:hypothetical protein